MEEGGERDMRSLVQHNEPQSKQNKQNNEGQHVKVERWEGNHPSFLPMFAMNGRKVNKDIFVIQFNKNCLKCFNCLNKSIRLFLVA